MFGSCGLSMGDRQPRRIGFLVNPIAGMGGRVGLKGTDDLVDRARELGATEVAPDRGARALTALAHVDHPIALVTWGAPMGADVAATAGLDATVLGEPDSTVTSAADTTEAVTAFLDAGVDVILFAGGDGTAVDVVRSVTDREGTTAILGIPAGVKVFSAVFAVTPEEAGRIAATFETTEEREVADLDEDAYRDGQVRSRVLGVVPVPVADTVQAGKQVRGGSVDAVVDGVLAAVDPDRTYFLGPGGTLAAIKRGLGFDGSPLGVDVWHDDAVLARDAAADDLRQHLADDPVIVVSPIGGQGFVFGRGNQQFAPDVIRAADIEIVASRAKLDDVGVLRVDTGDPELDEELRGWVKVRIGRYERRLIEIV